MWGFQFLLILDLWGISFHAVLVSSLGKNLLCKSVLVHCKLVVFISKNPSLKNLCGSQCGGFQFLSILDLWGISFHAVVVFGPGKNLFFKSFVKKGKKETNFCVKV